MGRDIARTRGVSTQFRINDHWRIVFRWTDAGAQARFDLETAEDVLAPRIKKITPYEAA